MDTPPSRLPFHGWIGLVAQGFIDNRTSLVKDDLVRTVREGDCVSVAAASFSMYAYRELREQLENVDAFRFIYTSQAFTQDQTTKQQREFYIPRLQREQSLYGTRLEIRLRNELTQKAVAAECAAWIRSGRARFMSFGTDSNFAPFLGVEHADGAGPDVYMPFQEFSTTQLGVSRHASSYQGVGRMDGDAARGFLAQFEQAWNSGELHDVTERVVDGIERMYRENPPELVYYMALYRIFSEFLDDVSEDVLPKEGTGFRESLIWSKLYDFQRDAALAIINKLETYDGCILADSVGLGKTFTALAVIKYYESRNRNVLVLCPKKLKDNWITYNSTLVNNPIAGDRLRYDVLFQTDLNRTSGTSETGMPLDRINWGAYDLVVIDESHNFRNGGDSASDEKMNRYQLLMERVIRQGVPTKVLMLSATPVNNRFRDLRNQLALAYSGEPERWAGRLHIDNDVETVFSNAQTVYARWAKLPAAERTTATLAGMLDFDFFEVLDQVTVARSRSHIQRYYDMNALGPFPHRLTPVSKRPRLSTDEDANNYHEIYHELESLTLAVYVPSAYLQRSRLARYAQAGASGNLTVKGRESGIHKLMTTNLLKRLESSVDSFRLTLERMRSSMRDAVDTIDAYRRDGRDRAVDGTLADGRADLDADDAAALETDGAADKVMLSDIDWIRWGHDISADIAVVDGLLAMVSGIDAAHDAKLVRLCEQIRDKAARPINAGNRKVLVFTAFADTARYLYEHVSRFAADELGLHTALITGDGCASTIKRVPASMQEILTCFSPVSKERALVYPHLEGCDIDIVIATDCISEGQNLQDCDMMINYDIHWNPVRIVQRFGRIDRIGSANQDIQLVNYWPDVELDEYINLKERVEQRMRITVMTSTGDDDYINTDEHGDLEYRRRQLEQMQREVIDLEDASGGVSITDLGLNEFRMDLIGYHRDNPDIDALPTGIEAVVEGDEPGIVFVLRNTNPAVNTHGRNRLHPYYLVHVADDGSIAHGHLDPKDVLDAMRRMCRGRNEPDAQLCRGFNKETRNGKDMHGPAALLHQAVGSVIASKKQSDVDSFFADGPTGFLENDIQGLDDFELICFLVVKKRC